MKKAWFLVFVLALLVPVLVATALADNSDFVIKDGVLIEYKGPGGDIVIPDGVKVIGNLPGGNGSSVGIFKPVFSDRTKITSITFPDSLTAIGEASMFYGAPIKSVTLPKNLEYIGLGAFANCTQLESIAIPAHVEFIGNEVFMNCTNLKEVTFLGDEDIRIAGWAFGNCTALTEITLGAGLSENFSNYAFAGCTNLKHFNIRSGGDRYCAVDGVLFSKDMRTLVAFPLGRDGEYVIPDGVRKIGSLAFYTTALEHITIPSGAEEICEYAFIESTALRQVSIREGISKIGISAFSDCSNLTDAILPNSVTSIGYNAFLNCTSLKSATIPRAVTEIGNGIFNGCSSLTDIKVDLDNPNYCDVNGILCNKSLTTLILYPSGRSYAEFPNGIDRIGAYAFCGCQKLTSVVIPDSVKRIEEYAFYGCTGLKTVVIPDSVTRMDYRAFADCTSLTSVIIPDSITSIEGTFSGCSGLSEVVIPESVTTLSKQAFSGCTSLSSVTIPESVTTLGNSGVFEGCSLTNVVIPSGVTYLGSFLFHGCSSLKSVSIPASVTEIREWVFGFCDNLTDIYFGGSKAQWDLIQIGYNNDGLEHATIHYNSYDGAGSETSQRLTWTLADDGTLTVSGEGDMVGAPPWDSQRGRIKKVVITEGITKVGNAAFYDCGNLTTVQLPAGIIQIGNEAFAFCNSLEEINLPDSVIKIGDSAFSSCQGLKKIVIPQHVAQIGNKAFSFCTGLEEINVPDSIIWIGNNAFEHCDGLTGFHIPDGVTSIGVGAFSGCNGLTSITIPRSVTFIGIKAFDECYSLTEVQVAADNPEYQSIDGVLFNKSGDTLLSYPCHKDLEAYVIPSFVTSIAQNAFYGCVLSGVTMPDSLKHIGTYAFAECGSLRDVSIPSGVTIVERYAFAFCFSLKHVSLPSSVTRIDDAAFASNRLSDVYFSGTEAQWNAITFGERNEPLTNAAIHFNSTGPVINLSSQKLVVDGKEILCEKYNIDGYNYFKLRDIAYLLNGTSAQFSVGWSASSGRVSITTGRVYTPVGGELEIGEDKSSSAVFSPQSIYIDGDYRVGLAVYNLAGNNYFKLRDLGEMLGFQVDYDSATDTAIVNSSR